jgi:hypothetical protein
LGLVIISNHQSKLEELIIKNQSKFALTKLKSFLAIYSTAKEENKICLVGSLATDFYTVDDEIQSSLQRLTDSILKWVIQILREGKAEGLFHFAISSRTKALMNITNTLAAVQLTRLTSKGDFETIKQTIIDALMNTNK